MDLYQEVSNRIMEQLDRAFYQLLTDSITLPLHAQFREDAERCIQHRLP